MFPAHKRFGPQSDDINGARLSEAPVHLVADLLDEESGDWNAELVCQTFIAADANAIVGMPRPRALFGGFWAWDGEKNGVFSIRSAYRLLLQNNLAQNSEATSSSHGTSNFILLFSVIMLCSGMRHRISLI